MMLTGSLPPTTIYGTWIENIEVWSADDDTLMDLSGVDEITVKLRDPGLTFDELTLTMSDGSVTVPSDGVIQWRAEAGTMGTLTAKTYEVIILIEGNGDVVPLVLGPISIME